MNVQATSHRHPSHPAWPRRGCSPAPPGSSGHPPLTAGPPPEEHGAPAAHLAPLCDPNPNPPPAALTHRSRSAAPSRAQRAGLGWVGSGRFVLFWTSAQPPEVFVRQPWDPMTCGGTQRACWVRFYLNQTSPGVPPGPEAAPSLGPPSTEPRGPLGLSP